jgi:hypothetical protein
MAGFGEAARRERLGKAESARRGRLGKARVLPSIPELAAEMDERARAQNLAPI